jgi:hypothetical protein
VGRGVIVLIVLQPSPSQEAVMKLAHFALGVILAAAASTGAPVGAQAQNYPWCAHLDFGDEVVTCSFVSFDQCMLTVRGEGGFCMANNEYPPVTPAPSHRWHKHSSQNRS